MALSLAPMGGQNNLSGEIFDIQAYSVHDGPGTRTLVFLSGCPLRCDWCANPEGLEKKNRNIFRVTKCVNRKRNCTRCIQGCPNQAISLNTDLESEIPLNIDWEKCYNCKTLQCTEDCLEEAFKQCSKIYTVQDLMQIFNRDRRYWSSNGGVTFSGGEPFFQKDFLLAILKACQDVYIHTAIETSGFAPEDVYLKAMHMINFAFNDLKHINSAKHEEKTGVPNEQILSNIAALARTNWQGRMVLRSPIIEDFNDNEENIVGIAEFMKKVGLKEFNLLPFHRLGDSKWKQCGMEYPYSFFEATRPEVLHRLKKIFVAHGITAYVGSDTPF